jgi:hypothetical protein
MALTPEQIKEIEWFNEQVMMKRNLMSRMINGIDNDYRTTIMRIIINHMKHSYLKIPSSNVPIPIHETFEILDDFSGAKLLKYIKISLGTNATDEEKMLDDEEQNNARLESVMTIVNRMQKVVERWPTQLPPELAARRDELTASMDLPDEKTEVEKLQIGVDYIDMTHRSRTNPKQVKTYKRFIFLIQLNCYMRSIGLQANERGAEINYQRIMKDAQDIILFCAPSLWPKKVMPIILRYDDDGRFRTYPSEDMRNSIDSLYNTFMWTLVNNIIGLKIRNTSDLMSATPMGELLRVARSFVNKIINSTDPWIRRK